MLTTRKSKTYKQINPLWTSSTIVFENKQAITAATTAINNSSNCISRSSLGVSRGFNGEEWRKMAKTTTATTTATVMVGAAGDTAGEKAGDAAKRKF